MKHKVLCIDDEVHNLEALERLLRKDYQVVTAESGAEGLQRLAEHQFSLIISDQKMPNMTGVQFFMKALALQPDAIRILLTGYTDLESVIEAINQGQIYRYITKPWEPQELIGITKQAIDVFEMKGTIARQNQELKAANDELRSLDKLKTDFMLLVNHELKTPLTAIFSFSQLLNEESLNEEQSLYVDKIQKNTERLQGLISDTLLITRLNSNQQSLEKQQVDLRNLVESSWQAQQSKYPENKMILNIDSTDIFEKPAHPEFIQTILGKLLENCFRHGKVSSEVQIKLYESGDSWFLQTQNEMLKPIERTPEQLLSAFTRNEDILNHTQGSGLGLAVIESIAKLFSARLKISYDEKIFNILLEFPNS